MTFSTSHVFFVLFFLVMFEEIKIYFSLFHTGSTPVPPLFYFQFFSPAITKLITLSHRHILLYMLQEQKKNKFSTIAHITIIHHFDLSLAAIKLGNFVMSIRYVECITTVKVPSTENVLYCLRHPELLNYCRQFII